MEGPNLKQHSRLALRARAHPNQATPAQPPPFRVSACRSMPPSTAVVTRMDSDWRDDPGYSPAMPVPENVPICIKIALAGGGGGGPGGGADAGPGGGGDAKQYWWNMAMRCASNVGQVARIAFPGPAQAWGLPCIDPPGSAARRAWG
jgi:hypothetical protein